MRISDWSSDVCSSDLQIVARRRLVRERVERPLSPICGEIPGAVRQGAVSAVDARLRCRAADGAARARLEAGHRSEEHTSGLQSLMRISYAVFCLKKKKQTTRATNNQTRENTT